MATRAHTDSTRLLARTLVLAALWCAAADAQAAPDNNDTTSRSFTEQLADRLYWGGQITVISQQLFKFHSPYAGPNSLRSEQANEVSHTYTLYAGIRLLPSIECYINPEMARGGALSDTLGLAGFTNGDVIRNPDIGSDPYLARYFVRWTIATGEGHEHVERAQNRMAGERPLHRLVITAGKLSTADIFDLNGYANSTRVQFMNWALINSAAYDYAADTRGYTHGIAVEWIHPDWAVRLGAFQMPKIPNGPNLSNDLIDNRGDQAEVEVHPHLLGGEHDPLVARLLGYRNLAHMGDYRDALELGRQMHTAPNIRATERTGAAKYGFGLSLEQPLADDGATGVFARWGWNDGATETFAYTEADRTATIGGQLSGAWWWRPPDHVALALVQNDLSTPHSDYLAAGGLGFILGDGRLHYGSERILETYYTLQPFDLVGLSLDYQLIDHPGYNRDRGPVSVVSLRLHIERS